VRSLRTALIALVGLALPIGLALAVYFASAGTIAATPASIDVTTRIGQPGSDENSDSRREKREKERPEGGTTTSGTTTREDISGPCDEAEHADDPRCSGSGDGDNSGSGSSNSGSGSSNSGSGSSNSGSGGDD
jgi:hypothetical protein